MGVRICTRDERRCSWSSWDNLQAQPSPPFCGCVASPRWLTHKLLVAVIMMLAFLVPEKGGIHLPVAEEAMRTVRQAWHNHTGESWRPCPRKECTSVSHGNAPRSTPMNVLKDTCVRSLITPFFFLIANYWKWTTSAQKGARKINYRVKANMARLPVNIQVKKHNIHPGQLSKISCDAQDIRQREDVY